MYIVKTKAQALRVPALCHHHSLAYAGHSELQWSSPQLPHPAHVQENVEGLAAAEPVALALDAVKDEAD